MTNVGRPPVNSPYKVQPYREETKKGQDFEASWNTNQARPHSFVVMKAQATKAMNANAVQFMIFFVKGAQRIQVGTVGAALTDGKAEAKWCAKPFDENKANEGVYHFTVSTGAFKGETSMPLVLTPIDTFTAAQPKPKVVF
ncbi:MAG: hypothetical protein LUM44_17420 [Pyrinomonadaceae bacterium]|nr:hypothetical protein [Pyrinomonadaceae bacterium]